MKQRIDRLTAKITDKIGVKTMAILLVNAIFASAWLVCQNDLSKYGVSAYAVASVLALAIAALPAMDNITLDDLVLTPPEITEK